MTPEQISKVTEELLDMVDAIVPHLDAYSHFCMQEYEKARAAMRDEGDDGWWGRSGPTAVEALIAERDAAMSNREVEPDRPSEKASYWRNIADRYADEIEEHQREHDKVEHEFAAAVSECKALEKKLSGVISERDALKTQLSFVVAERIPMQRERDEARASRDELRARLSVVEADYEKEKGAALQLGRDVDIANGKLKLCNARVDEIGSLVRWEGGRENVVDAVQRVVRERDEAKASCEAFQKELNALRTGLNRRNMAYNDIAHKLNEIRKERDELFATLKDLAEMAEKMRAAKP